MSECKEFIVRVRNADLIAGSLFGTPYFHGEIVRCMDCANHTYTPNGSCRCDYWMTFVEPDGFCAWGERRTDDN